MKINSTHHCGTLRALTFAMTCLESRKRGQLKVKMPSTTKDSSQLSDTLQHRNRNAVFGTLRAFTFAMTCLSNARTFTMSTVTLVDSLV